MASIRYRIGVSDEVLKTECDNDYFFCEDKVISIVSKYYGSDYELAYSKSFNFRYNNLSKETSIGKKILTSYNDLSVLLDKYYGISFKKIENNNKKDYYVKLIDELKKGKPVIVSLNNSQKLWSERAESIGMLIYLVTWIEDDQIELLDFHHWGKRIVLSKTLFCDSLNWIVLTNKKEVLEDPYKNYKEIIRNLLDESVMDLDDRSMSFDVLCEFLTVQNIKCEKLEKKYGDINGFLEEFENSDLIDDFKYADDLLFLPIYSDTLILFRTRMLCANVLYKIFEHTSDSKFCSLSHLMMETSSLWNALRLIIQRVYHVPAELEELRLLMKQIVRKICKLENNIKISLAVYLNELEENDFDYEVLRSASENINDLKNFYLFSQKKTSLIDAFGKMYCKSELNNCFVDSMNGDAIVCLGQRYMLHNKAQKVSIYLINAFSEPIACSFDVLKKGMLIDSKKILLDGWNDNNLDCCRQINIASTKFGINLIKKDSNDEKHYTNIICFKYENKEGFDEIKIPLNPQLYLVGIREANNY